MTDGVSRFQDLADRELVSPKVVNVITKEMGLETMTDVQKMTLNACLDGTDVYVLA